MEHGLHPSSKGDTTRFATRETASASASASASSSASTTTITRSNGSSPFSATVLRQDLSTTLPITPIGLIPIEILRMIFSFTVFSHSRPEGIFDRFARLKGLMHVCKYWHHVVVDSPELWRHIHLSPLSSSDISGPLAKRSKLPYPTGLVDLFLTRSKMSPLDISFFPCRINEWMSTSTLLTNTSERWTSFSFTLETNIESTDSILDTLSNAPNLHTLSLRAPQTFEFASLNVLDHYLYTHPITSPNLHTLRLVEWTCNYKCMPRVATPNLKKVEIQTGSSFTPCVKQLFYTIAERMPQLERRQIRLVRS